MKIKKKIIFIVLGLALITFAIIPTPDDITVISPILAFTVGVSFIYDAFKGGKK